jgi:hypothetical protein
MTGKMTVTKCFKCDDDFERFLGNLLISLPEYNLSEIIRQSVLIASPFLREHPMCSKSVGIPGNRSQ